MFFFCLNYTESSVNVVAPTSSYHEVVFMHLAEGPILSPVQFSPIFYSFSIRKCIPLLSGDGELLRLPLRLLLRTGAQFNLHCRANVSNPYIHMPTIPFVHK